jgi:hypothetical protein
VLFVGQLNRLLLAGVESRQRHAWRRSDSPNFQPLRETLEPGAHRWRRTRVIKLRYHRRRYEDAVIQRGEHILTVDLNQVIER